MPTKYQFDTKYVFAISIIAALGGLLFGYDWVVIGGAKPFYENFFHIMGTPVVQGWVMSSALLGCLVGATASGLLSELLGRKKLLITAALFFTVSAIGTGASNILSWFISFRILGGIGIGIASSLSPVYIAEVSPASMRGKFVSINQFTIVLGILAAQIVNWQIARPVPPESTNIEILNSWNGQMGWRWMFWAETIPAALFFILMFLIPESPRWLVKKGSYQKVKDILRRIGGSDYAEEELHDIQETLKKETEKVNFGYLLKPGIRKVVIIGIVIAVFQQWCGINVIFNYAQEVFSAAGYDVSDLLFNIVITGSVNLIFTVVAFYTVDLLGRRKLMLFGSGGLAIIYLFIGAFYLIGISGWPMVLLILLAIACYAMTLAPVTWVVLSEIFPNKIRGVAMGVATFFLWSACFILTYTFPILNEFLKAFGTFWLYGFICVLGFFFIFKNLPETMQMSLEDIEREIINK